jgi:hypothetical protein
LSQITLDVALYLAHPAQRPQGAHCKIDRLQFPNGSTLEPGPGRRCMRKTKYVWTSAPPPRYVPDDVWLELDTIRRNWKVCRSTDLRLVDLRQSGSRRIIVEQYRTVPVVRPSLEPLFSRIIIDISLRTAGGGHRPQRCLWRPPLPANYR